ncbi:hypothetical protein QNH10_15370 [Sporosarcina thermotolerans]|uniref:hypothetical protein n=1 Tax=Sporosarcina thermotolerans TaxID=633404 RepID=UPI0024BCB8D0|nr:hypothetical protein [Sporosarcina thermotolerans]WHT47526.1 hypothetical protein QNH10_15370 [Sporosarcina thermotolerans]
METLIIAVVLGFISMLFKGKKPGEESKTQTKRPSTQSKQQQWPSAKPDTRAQDPLRRLKEMSQEMYKEIQREFQTEIDEPPSRQTEPANMSKMVPVEEKPQEISKPSQRREREKPSQKNTHRGRLSTHQGEAVWEKPVEQSHMIPKTNRILSRASSSLKF